MPMTSELNYRAPVKGKFETESPAIDARSLQDKDWVATSNRARRAIVEDGFLRITLQDAQVERISTLQDGMAGFFAKDETDKAVFRDQGADFGWTPCFEEPAYQPGTIASVESFDLTRDALYGDSAPAWPSEPDLRTGADDTWRLFNELGDSVLELLARATGIPDQFLVDNCNSRELNSLRLLHYPAQDNKPEAHEVGIAAHTDFECITLLYQSAPGLEIRRPDSSWETAPARPDTLIVLFGDMLERWTNGEIQATGHRVGRPDQERLSIVMFIAANKGLKVGPLSHFVGQGRPALYEELEQSSHIEREVERAMKQRINS
jgi:isopenicillin N synthase-like dioxygenase